MSIVQSTGSTVERQLQSRTCNQCRKPIHYERHSRLCGECDQIKMGGHLVKRLRLEAMVNRSKSGSLLDNLKDGASKSVQVHRSMTKNPSLLLSHCISCMNELRPEETRLNTPMMCTACRRSLAKNPTADPQASAKSYLTQPHKRSGAGAAGKGSDPPPMLRLHFNCRGERVGYPDVEYKLNRISTTQFTFSSGDIIKKNQRGPSKRTCWRSGCGNVVLSGLACEKCIHKRYIPVSEGVTTKAIQAPVDFDNELGGRMKYPLRQQDVAPDDVLVEKNKDKVNNKDQAMGSRRPVPRPPRPTASVSRPATRKGGIASAPKVVPYNAPSQPQSQGANTHNHDSALQTQPPRTCETKDCSRHLPPSTKWARCTECSLKKLKRRLHGKKHGERSPKKRRGARGVGSASASEDDDIRGWDSDPNVLKSDKDDRKDSEHSSASSGPETEPIQSGLVIRIPKLVAQFSSPSTSVTTPATLDNVEIDLLPESESTSALTRVCVIKNCTQALRPSSRDKLCEGCRKRHREYNRKWPANAKGDVDDFAQKPVRLEEEDLGQQNPTITPSHNADPSRLIPSPSENSVARPSHKLVISPVRHPALKSASTSPTTSSNAISLPLYLTRPLRVSTPTPAYPLYQSLSLLAEDLHSRLNGFLNSHVIWASSAKLLPSLPEQPVVFSFDGEYSVIFTNGKKQMEGDKAVNAGIDMGHQVLREIGRITKLIFRSTNSFGINTGGVLMRFSCQHHIPITARNPVSGLSNDANSETKTMAGELEIIAMPDASHRYFPGQRCIIRFRFVG